MAERDELLAWFDSRAMVHRSALAAAAQRAVDFFVVDDDSATSTEANCATLSDAAVHDLGTAAGG